MSRNSRMADFGYRTQEVTIGRLLADGAARNAGKPFLTWLEDGTALTYAEMHQRSNDLAKGLMARGVGRATHVAVMMDNCPEQVLVYFALGKIGAVAVPVNTSARGRLLARQLEHADITHAIAEPHFLVRLDEAAVAASRRVHCISAEIACEPSVPPEFACGGPVADLCDVAASGSSSLAKLPDDVAFSDLAMLSYTSGTTGLSKANMFPQAAVPRFGMTTAESYRYTPADVIYICLPLNHANAYLCALWGAWVAGASVALARRFSASRFWSDVRRSGGTGTSLLGSMVNLLWARPRQDDDADNRLRFTVLTPVLHSAHRRTHFR